MAVQALLYRMGHCCYDRKINHVAYVLEAGHRSQKHVDKFLSLVVRTPVLRQKMRIWGYAWGTKDDSTLHPADLLSHELATFGPLGDTLWKRAKQEHIGPEEIEKIERVVLGGLTMRRV